MRLLNTATLKLKEFDDKSTPSYATLSHRWGEEEITCEDLAIGNKINTKGHIKIFSCCELASRQGHEWVWIDTCCIDKKSSAELSEAINSMYHWYHDATVCYVYLDDVSWYKDATTSERNGSIGDFDQSKWFTRGWTLQELLAPLEVHFYDRDWRFIGVRNNTNSQNSSELASEISRITGIEIQYIQKQYLVKSACVAVKMSWLSKRRTSRNEDMAYCMLGLFDVNIPLLYGEGNKSFARLQHEIIKQSEDETIFAWADGRAVSRTSWRPRGGPFAPDPTFFEDCGSIQRLEMQRPPWSMTNRGLAIHIPNTDIDGENRAKLRLNCWDSKLGAAGVNPADLAITISLIREKPGSDNFLGVCHDAQRSNLATSVPSEEDKKHTTCIYIVGIYI